MRKGNFSEENFIGVLREHEAGAKVEDLCHRHGISTTTLYKWKAKYGGMTVPEAKRAAFAAARVEHGLPERRACWMLLKTKGRPTLTAERQTL